MRRLVVTGLILVAAATTAAAASGSVPLVAKSKATVKVKSCSLEEKSAVFYARMRKLHGTRRMKMRFGLLERAAGAQRFKRVRVRGLSRRHRSGEGVRAYGYSQEVRGLQGGATYRMRVRYRWYDEDGDLQRSVRRTSRSCRMFVPLANLRLRLIDRLPLGGGTWRYHVRVTNAGQAAADGVATRLFVDGAPAGSEVISHLEPGESFLIGLDGPACNTRYSIRIDPDGTVPESNESDNSASAFC
jgi:hypothetical protein